MDISLGLVAVLLSLVSNGVLGSRGACAQACVSVLCDRLVGLLGCLGSGTLDGLSDVVCGLLWRELACVDMEVRVFQDVDGEAQVKELNINRWKRI